MKRLILALIVPLLGACSTMSGDPNISIAQVKGAPAQHMESSVRWGGKILDITNNSGNTELVILSYPLDLSDKPLLGEGSTARFIARVKGFLDPGDFKEDRLVTVSGKVKGVIERQIGGYTYQYPVVDVDEVKLWTQSVDRVYYAYPARPYPYVYGGVGWYSYGPYPYWWY